MKICIVMPSHWSTKFGGAEYQVSLLTERLLQRAPMTELCFIARHISEDTVRTGDARRLEAPSYLHRFGFFVDAPGLYRALCAERPSTVYQRVGCAYTGVAAYYCRRFSKRLVWHISIDSDLTDRIGRFPPVARSLERRMRDYGIRRATDIVAQTKQQAAALMKHFGRNAHVIPNFHPMPDQAIHKTSHPSVVWVANLKAAKRPELFLELAHILSNEPGIRFTMVGRGGDSEPYRTLIRDAQKSMPFEYRGELSQRQVNELIGSAWVLVNTSIDEGFPNTFIQAWQRHALVASATVNPDSLLDKFGIGAQGMALDDFAERIRHFLQHAADRARITTNAAEHAARHHSLDNADRIVDLLLET